MLFVLFLCVVCVLFVCCLCVVLSAFGSVSFPLMVLLVEYLGSLDCCRAVARQYFPSFAARLAEEAIHWRLIDDSLDVWSCLEGSFWSLRGQSGVRDSLWHELLESNDLRFYEVTESLTVQFAFKPAFEHGRRSHKSNCVEDEVSQAIDHLIVGGAERRARETFVLGRSFRTASTRTDGGRLVRWPSFAATGKFYMALSPLTSSPWWQRHL